MNAPGKRHVELTKLTSIMYMSLLKIKLQLLIGCAKLHVTCESSGKDLGSNSLHGTHAKLNFNSEHLMMVHNIQHTQLASTNQTLYHLIGLFKIKHTTSCIPICVLLVDDGILQYSIWLWALYSTGGNLTSAITPKRQHAVEYSSRWLETAAVAAFPVVEITDRVRTLLR